MAETAIVQLIEASGFDHSDWPSALLGKPDRKGQPSRPSTYHEVVTCFVLGDAEGRSQHAPRVLIVLGVRAGWCIRGCRASCHGDCLELDL